jgi:hypothetical protein
MRPRIRRTALSLATAVAAFAALQLVLPALASAYPPTTTAYYEGTTSTTTLYNQGCSAGQSLSGGNGLAVLDFGRPAYSNGAYGTIDFNGNFETNTAILNGIKAYADGYWACSPVGGPTMNISRGTSNYCPGCSSFGVPDYTSAGSFWAQRVNDLASYISSSGYSSQEISTGADDAEPAWDSGYTATSNFITGYTNSSNAHTLFDYGSMEGGYWTQEQAWTVAYSGYDYPLPEVYVDGQAQEWENLSLYSVSTHGYPMIFRGVTSEYPAAGTYTPHQSYDAMLNQLNSHSSTAQSGMDYIIDI